MARRLMPVKAEMRNVRRSADRQLGVRLWIEGGGEIRVSLNRDGGYTVDELDESGEYVSAWEGRIPALDAETIAV